MNDTGWVQPARSFRRLLAYIMLAIVLVLLGLLATGFGWVALTYGMDEVRPDSIARCDLPLISRAFKDPKVNPTVCYIKALNSRMKSNNPVKIVAYAQNLYDADPNRKFSQNCHLVMHELGRRYGDRADVDELMKVKYGFCPDGFIHGQLMAAVADTSASASDIKKMLNACARRSLTTEGKFACYHGGGHGFMRSSKSKVGPALDRCVQLGGAQRQRPCASGAFMEIVLGSIAVDGARKTELFPEDDPGSTCEGVPEAIQGTCIAWAAKQVLPPPKAAEWCSKQAQNVRESCRLGIGASHAVERVPPCDEELDCWVGVGYMFGSNFQETALERCTLRVDASHLSGKALQMTALSACTEGIGWGLASHSSKGRASGDVPPDDVCDALPKPDRVSCMNGAKRYWKHPIDFV